VNLIYNYEVRYIDFEGREKTVRVPAANVDEVLVWLVLTGLHRDIAEIIWIAHDATA